MSSPALSARLRTAKEVAAAARDAAHEYFAYASRALARGDESTADHFLDLARRRLERAQELESGK